MKNMKIFKSIFLALPLIMIAFLGQSQPASPPATATGKVGEATITIKYSSPSVKGRQIWGALVPYDKVWRAGCQCSHYF